MTFEEFNNLKINDEVYLPDTNREGKFMSTEVLEINQEAKTVKVFLDNDKFRPYEYVQKSVPLEQVSCFVGMGNSPRMLMYKYMAILSSDKFPQHV